MSQQVSRRAVARGAAWTVPLVAVAVAAPAFAVSAGTGATVSVLGGCRCGVGGGPLKTYRLDVTFTNPTSDTFTITNPDVTIAGDFAIGETLQPTSPPQTGMVQPGGGVLSYTFTRGGNPSADFVTFTYTSTGTNTSASPGTFSANVAWGTCTNTCQSP